MNKRKVKTSGDRRDHRPALFGADTVSEITSLTGKLLEGKELNAKLDHGALEEMVAFLETFENAGVERKFVLHHVTQAIMEERSERLLCWAIIAMRRQLKLAPDHLQREMLKLFTERLS